MCATRAGIGRVAREDVRISIRPIRQSDVRRLLEMHDRLSDDSLYYRYLVARKPSLGELQQLAAVHGQAGTVLVAALKGLEEKVVGVAYFVLQASTSSPDADQPQTAEWAILVEDAFQGLGLGRKLMDCLVKKARAMNVQRLHAETHPANRRVMRLIRGTGIPAECSTLYGVREVTMQLEPA